MTPEQKVFMNQCSVAARQVSHPFPDMAAAEAALESNYGKSKLAVDGLNLFGRKQSRSNPVYASISIPTWECLLLEQINPANVLQWGDVTLDKKKRWVKVPANWVKYPTVEDCFADRLATLERLQDIYPEYKAALESDTPEEYVKHVSKSWSTDPERATKVILIYRQYIADFEQPA